MSSIELADRKKICVEAPESGYDADLHLVQPQMEVCHLEFLLCCLRSDQVLQRRFKKQHMTGFSCTLTITWEGLLLYACSALLQGPQQR
jgi:hypothetical protein